MRNTLSCWQKKQKPLPITGREEREREDERRKVGEVGGEWKSKRWGRDHLDSCGGKCFDRNS